VVEGIVSKRKGSPYRSGRSPDWLKMKNPDAPAVKRGAEEDCLLRRVTEGRAGADPPCRDGPERSDAPAGTS
jgi:ATP-dependent DNA ligase